MSLPLRFIVLLFCPLLSIQAQSFREGELSTYERLTINDGISQGYISAILQDRHGIMWFGTKDGLNRYDGYRFSVFRFYPSDTLSLSHNYITALYEDRTGTLWVGTAGGLNRLNGDGETFTRFIHSENDGTSLSHNVISSIVEDTSGTLWIGTRGGGLNTFQDGKFRHFLADSGSHSALSNNDIYSMVCSADGIIWISTGGGGINRFDPTTELFTHFQHSDSDNNSLSHNATFGIALNDGKLFIGTQAGLDVLNLASKKFSHHTISDKRWRKMRVSELMLGSEGAVWLNAYGFIARFDTASNTYSTFNLGNSYTVFYQDRGGVIWIGTAGAGIIKYNPRVERFGLRRANMLNAILPKAYIQKYSAKHTNARSILRIDQSTWVMKRDGELLQYTPNGNFAASYRMLLNKEDVRGTHLLVNDTQGNLWSAVDRGLIRFDRRKKQFERINIYPPDKELNGTRYHDITALFFDHAGVLWIGTPTLGLIRFDPITRSTKFFTHRGGEHKRLSHDFILCITEDSDEPEHRLWIGTDGGGMNVLDLRTEESSWITELDGLPSNVVYGILQDTAHTFWMSSNKGIVQYNPRTRVFRRFGAGDGLQSNEFNRYEYYKDASGTLYFGGIYGYNSFLPEQIKVQSSIPPVVFTDFQLFNRSMKVASDESPLKKPMSETDTVVLSYSHNVFSIEFISPDYSAPLEHQFLYQLDGFNDTWIPLGTAHNVTFTNLDPGSYTLRVKATNGSGIWDERHSSLHLIIVPPFWATVWFRVVVLVLAAAAVGGSVRALSVRKFRRRMMELEQQRAVERERLRISGDMHDELGGRLTQIGMLSDRAGRTKDAKQVRTTLRTIGTAARDVVSSLDEIVWAVNPGYDTLSSTLLYISRYAHEYLEQANIECTMEFPTIAGEIPLSAETRHNIFMVVKEALNNIVKHARATRVDLKCTFIQNTMTLSIYDNGIGFDTNTAPVLSEGLTNMRDRMNAVGGTFSLSSARKKGTTVSISVTVS